MSRKLNPLWDTVLDFFFHDFPHAHVFTRTTQPGGREHPVCTHHAPRHISSDPPEVTISRPTLSEPSRSHFDPLVPPSLPSSPGQSLRFESLSRSSRWRSRRDERRDGRWGEGGEPASAQGSRQSDCSGQRDGMRDRELEERGWRPHSSFEAKQQEGGHSQRNLPGSPPDKPSGIQEEEERKMGEQIGKEK